jgi:flavin reductase (DIM6/NTAB) family NADH-FMN oxidoreductase RutF
VDLSAGASTGFPSERTAVVDFTGLPQLGETARFARPALLRARRTPGGFDAGLLHSENSLEIVGGSMTNTDATTAPSDPVGTMLGRIPSGLFIVTWREDDADRTMLTSWLMQAGFEPPAISIAVGRDRQFLKAAESGELRFVVNLLADSQRNLLGRFGKPAPEGHDLFAGLAISRAPCGAVILPETVGWMECRVRSLPPTSAAAPGDHLIVIGDITVAGTGPGAAPLVHLRKSGLHY